MPFWTAILPSIISAGATLLGGASSDRSSRDQAAADRAFHREFAQNSVQWRVNDARAAGIHPLHALGSPLVQPSPTSVGGGRLGDAISQVGQDISRAREATATRREREAERVRQIYAAKAAERQEAREDERHRSEMRLRELEARLLLADLARKTQPGTPPARPGSVAGENSPRRVEAVVVEPNYVDSSDGARNQGAIADVQFQRRRGGALAVVPSRQAAERMSDMLPEQLDWFTRNRLIPGFGGAPPVPSPDPREFPLPSGATHYRWDWWSQQYVPERWSGQTSRPPQYIRRRRRNRLEGATR